MYILQSGLYSNFLDFNHFENVFVFIRVVIDIDVPNVRFCSN